VFQYRANVRFFPIVEDDRAGLFPRFWEMAALAGFPKQAAKRRGAAK